MLPFSLQSAINLYISAIDYDNLNDIVLQLSQATNDEIFTEYNRLTSNDNWVDDDLVSAFSDELLKRISDATYMISCTWIDIRDYQRDPWVLIQMSFEDRYLIYDEYLNPISTQDDQRKSFSLSNRSFSDEDADTIRKILINDRIGISGIIAGDRMEFTRIFDSSDPGYGVSRSTTVSSQSVSSPRVVKWYSNEILLMQTAINGLRGPLILDHPGILLELDQQVPE